MIKYFIRHYWRYLAMALAFATITFLINSCEVQALENFISPVDLSFRGYTSSNTWQTSYCTSSTDSTCYYFPLNEFKKLGWFTGNGGYTFNNTKMILFNATIVSRTGYTSNQLISNVSFQDLPCYYFLNDRTAIWGDDPSTTYYYEQISAICPTNKNITISGNSKIIEIDFTDNQTHIVDSISLSKVRFVQDSSLDTITTLLETNNGYLVTNNSLLNDIKNSNASINSWLTNNQQYFINYDSLLRDIKSRLDTLLEQNKVCNYYDKNSVEFDGYLTTTGSINTSTNTTGVTEYIRINSKAKIEVVTAASGINYCFYNINKTKISCEQPLSTGQITVPNDASYIRLTINKNSNKPTYEICQNGNQAIANNQEEIHNSITDSSIDSPSSDLDEMNQNEISNSVISDLLLLPLNMFSNIVDSIGGTCSSFALGSLFGTNLTLPCIDIESLIGSNLWGVIDVLFCGIFVLSIRKRFVDIFENITSLKDRGNELE